MPFDIDPVYVVYALAAGSAILFVEAIYLTFFSATSYRSRINRRLRLMDGQPDRESILIQLRRERGLTGEGLYSLPILSLNRLVLQSGLAMGLPRS
jgi:tight adherence protein B